MLIQDTSKHITIILNPKICLYNSDAMYVTGQGVL